MNRIAKRTAWVVGFLVSQLVLMGVVGLIPYWWYDTHHTVTVGQEAVPDHFPVVVVTPGNTADGHHAEVVWQRDLAAYLATHSEYSFAIPESEASTLRHQVESATRGRGAATSRFWFATFKVREREDGVQQLEVEGTFDDDYVNRSWYEVRDGSITGMKHLYYFGPGVGIAYAIPVLAGATILNLALWYGARRLARRLARRREATRSGGQEQCA